jgi:ABC-type multidrug transport system fused ATPase/permease subunit
MVDQLVKVWGLLSAAERRKFLILLPILLFGAVLDSAGVASVMPFIAVLANPNIAESNKYLNLIYTTLKYTSKSEFMKHLAILFFLVYVFAIAYKAMSSFIMTRYALMREYSIGRRLVHAYLEQPYEWFLNRHSSDLGKTILTEVGRVVGSVITPILQLLVQSAVVISLLSLLMAINYEAAITVGLLLALSYLSVYILQRGRLRRIGVNIENSNKMRYRMVNEAFSGIKNVKTMGLESYYEDRFSKPAYTFAKNISASNIAAQMPRYAMEIIAFGGILGLIFFLMNDYTSFQSILPILAVYVLAGYKLMPSIQQVYTSLAMLRVGGPTLDRLHSEFRTLILTDSAKGGHQIKPKVEIRMNSVSYRYPGCNNLNIKGLNLSIKASTTVGIVGPTGSGKTTALDIILGLLHPTEGSMMIDGEPITQKNVARWRTCISYVPQHIYLVDDTVSANIAYGVKKSECDMKGVKEAARIACLHEFIVSEMPEGYDTVIGERGVRLSGGQIQRLGIARALYRKAPLLVLDEATSALDNLTEGFVMNALRNLNHRPTIVIVAHRLSTVRECDHIFVMEHGCISDDGNYSDLSSRSGCFKDMLEEC